MTIRISFSDKTVRVAVELCGAIESAITELPQRPWVGLEAEDLAQIDTDEFWQTGNHMAIALAIEAALRSKNT
jgi:hypothetical protein